MLLKDKWNKEENLTVFMLKVKRSYRKTCELYDIEKIPGINLNTMIACRITGNMNDTGKWTYYNRLEKSPEKMVKEMEESFRYNKEYKNSLFKCEEITKDNTEDVKPKVSNETKENYYGTEIIKKCWHYGKGFCRFGGFCWYKHM